MRLKFLGTDVPFRAPGKKKEMKMYRLLLDIVAKALCAKPGSFDVTLVAMVHTPTKKSQGFAVQVSVLLQNLVKADLREIVKLHPQKVLNNKSVHTFMKIIWVLVKLVRPTGFRGGADDASTAASQREHVESPVAVEIGGGNQEDSMELPMMFGVASFNVSQRRKCRFALPTARVEENLRSSPDSVQRVKDQECEIRKLIRLIELINRVLLRSALR
ncbi:hypothetical protein F511_38784 [Dorcoceras hygrometricum]|uniref:Uncharacterized protein n=1 Tax=Dorcoceras hygrometricum TaxID=472368 RepID=A0A2Z7C056_9LAMI|nr:hypothetical protein F511_38784 [Dorcoceras hygrometricum]